MLNYFYEVAVKPEIEKLYLEVMGTIFKANESNREQEISRLKENLSGANKKLASLGEKYVLNEIEHDSYSFMRPRFKDEISKLREKLSDLESKETNYTRYLNSGITLLQNLSYYYEAASLSNKQKLIGSIFPENLIIENGPDHYRDRTARENEVIRVLKGFEQDFKKERPRNSRPFRSGSPGRNRTCIVRIGI